MSFISAQIFSHFSIRLFHTGSTVNMLPNKCVGAVLTLVLIITTSSAAYLPGSPVRLDGDDTSLVYNAVARLPRILQNVEKRADRERRFHVGLFEKDVWLRKYFSLFICCGCVAGSHNHRLTSIRLLVFSN